MIDPNFRELSRLPYSPEMASILDALGLNESSIGEMKARQYLYLSAEQTHAPLVHQQTFQPVPASERPWERERWLHPRGLWCWQWRPDSVSWQMTTCGFFFAPSDDSLLLPYWAIIDPESSEAS